jgi:hypothetical protein
MVTFVNDNVKIRIFTGIDISGYATLKMKYKKPDGTTGCWDAELCPLSNYYMLHSCTDDDLDVAGVWYIQAYIIGGGVELTGRWDSLTVLNSLTVCS